MGVAKLKCKHCGDYERKEIGKKTPNGFFCTIDHAVLWQEEARAKNRKRKEAKAKRLRIKEEKAVRAKDRRRLQELKPRNWWFGRLQDLVNQYVLHVRDVNEGCFTCGTRKPDIKYDAGHFYTRKARSDIRFELTNIHKQCSIKCNYHGSGMRLEYEKRIIEKYGESHLEFLKERKPDLKTQFPNWQDIEAEIIRYRALLRENGIRPKR